MTTALAELGERLQREHGTLWLHRLKGDPYAALLCDVDEDPGPLRELVRAAGPLWRSGTGPWVTADPATAAALLAHPAIEHVPTLPGEAPVTAVDVPDLATLCARVLDAAGPEFDLVTEVAEPLAAGALATVCEMPAAEHGRFAEAVAACGIAQDAVVCPQRLDATRQMRRSLDLLRPLPDTVPSPATIVTAARTGADLVARTVLRARLPVRADEVGPIVEAALRAEPPTWIAPLVARADLELAGARIATGERLGVLLQCGTGPAEVPAHRLLAPLYRALAESVLTALADRYTYVRSTAPLVRRPRAPLTRGPARAPMTAGTTTSGGAR